MKKIFIIIFLLLSLGGGGFYYFNNFVNKVEVKKMEENVQKKENKENIENIQEKENKENIENKLDILRKKIKLKGLIASGDILSKEESHIAAILKYKQALKEIPNDQELNKKIGDLYYDIKNFKKANEFYKNIKNYKKLDKDKAIKSLINSKGVNPGNINDLKKEISSFDLDDEKKYYYETSLDCVIDYSKCRDEFERYFSKNIEIKDENLINIKKALENFKNFSSKELYYKASFVSGAFFENSFFYLSLKTSEKVLVKKPDYQPMLKIAGKSAYEIGKYTEARDFLIRNKKLDSNDSQVSYFLARIYEKLNDKVLSLVHYKKALRDGYKDKADIYRRFLFIYFEEKNNEKMLEIFDKLLNLENKYLTSTDFSLGIYYNILNFDFKKAKNYAIKAINIFPEYEVFYSYYAWILLQNEELSNIELKIIDTNIQKAIEINNKNPMVLMVKGIYEYKVKNYNKAIIYLKNAYGLDKGAEYKTEIETWLFKVKEEKYNNNNNNNNN